MPGIVSMLVKKQPRSVSGSGVGFCILQGGVGKGGCKENRPDRSIINRRVLL